MSALQVPVACGHLVAGGARGMEVATTVPAMLLTCRLQATIRPVMHRRIAAFPFAVIPVHQAHAVLDHAWERLLPEV